GRLGLGRGPAPVGKTRRLTRNPWPAEHRRRSADCRSEFCISLTLSGWPVPAALVVDSGYLPRGSRWLNGSGPPRGSWTAGCRTRWPATSPPTPAASPTSPLAPSYAIRDLRQSAPAG